MLLPLVRKRLVQRRAALYPGLVLMMVACVSLARADDGSGTNPEIVNYLVVEDRAQPFQIAENGESQGGIISDMVAAIFSPPSWTLSPMVMPINRLLQTVADDEVSHWVSYDSMRWRSFGNKALMVDEPLLQTSYVLLTCRADLPNRVQRIEQLQGLKLVTVRHFDYPEIEQAARAGTVHQLTVDRYEAGIQLVQMGRADGFVEMTDRLQYFVASTENANCLRWINISEVIPDFPIYLSVSVDWPKTFRGYIAERIRELRAEGELEAISDRYKRVGR